MGDTIDNGTKYAIWFVLNITKFVFDMKNLFLRDEKMTALHEKWNINAKEPSAVLKLYQLFGLFFKNFSFRVASLYQSLDRRPFRRLKLV